MNVAEDSICEVLRVFVLRNLLRRTNLASRSVRIYPGATRHKRMQCQIKTISFACAIFSHYIRLNSIC